jgi:translation initiation factor IF-1
MNQTKTFSSFNNSEGTNRMSGLVTEASSLKPVNEAKPRFSPRKPKKLVDMEGVVTHNLSNGKFRLKLENGVEVIGHLSGKIRQNRIKIVVGDKVTVELSPYDLTKGRITYRHP